MSKYVRLAVVAATLAGGALAGGSASAWNGTLPRGEGGECLTMEGSALTASASGPYRPVNVYVLEGRSGDGAAPFCVPPDHR